MIKRGKRLEVTNMKDRLKLVVDGQKFVTKTEEIICIDADYSFLFGDRFFYDVKESVLLEDWYYLAATYTINGVELVDERVKEIIGGDFKEYYVCDCIRSDYFNYCNYTGAPNLYLQKIIERSLLHKTKEAAVLHTKAMMKVSA